MCLDFGQPHLPPLEMNKLKLNRFASTILDWDGPPHPLFCCWMASQSVAALNVENKKQCNKMTAQNTFAPVWLEVVGLLSSLLSFLWHATDYHVLIDGESRLNVLRQLKLLPFYALHLIFRAFMTSLIFTYWKVGEHLAQVLLHSSCARCGP